MSDFGYDDQDKKLVLQFVAGAEEEDEIFMYAKELLDHGSKPFVKIVMTRSGLEIMVMLEKPSSKEPEVENDGA
jgi:hypothetical protein